MSAVNMSLFSVALVYVFDAFRPEIKKAYRPTCFMTSWLSGGGWAADKSGYHHYFIIFMECLGITVAQS